MRTKRTRVVAGEGLGLGGVGGDMATVAVDVRVGGVAGKDGGDRTKRKRGPVRMVSPSPSPEKKKKLKELMAAKRRRHAAEAASVSGYSRRQRKPAQAWWIASAEKEGAEGGGRMPRLDLLPLGQQASKAKSKLEFGNADEDGGDEAKRVATRFKQQTRRRIASLFEDTDDGHGGDASNVADEEEARAPAPSSLATLAASAAIKSDDGKRREAAAAAAAAADVVDDVVDDEDEDDDAFTLQPQTPSPGGVSRDGFQFRRQKDTQQGKKKGGKSTSSQKSAPSESIKKRVSPRRLASEEGRSGGAGDPSTSSDAHADGGSAKGDSLETRPVAQLRDLEAEAGKTSAATIRSLEELLDRERAGRRSAEEALEVRLSALGRKNAELEEDLRALQVSSDRRVKESEAAAAEARLQVSQLEQQLTAMQSDLDHNNKACSDLRQSRDGLLSRCGELESLLEQARADKAALLEQAGGPGLASASANAMEEGGEEALDLTPERPGEKRAFGGVAGDGTCDLLAAAAGVGAADDEEEDEVALLSSPGTLGSPGKVSKANNFVSEMCSLWNPDQSTPPVAVADSAEAAAGEPGASEGAVALAQVTAMAGEAAGKSSSEQLLDLLATPGSIESKPPALSSGERGDESRHPQVHHFAVANKARKKLDLQPEVTAGSPLGSPGNGAGGSSETPTELATELSNQLCNLLINKKIIKHWREGNEWASEDVSGRPLDAYLIAEHENRLLEVFKEARSVLSQQEFSAISRKAHATFINIKKEKFGSDNRSPLRPLKSILKTRHAKDASADANQQPGGSSGKTGGPKKHVTFLTEKVINEFGSPIKITL